MTTAKKCKGPGCPRKPVAHELCHGHYKQHQQGTPLKPIRARVNATARDDRDRKQCQTCHDWKPEDEYGSRDSARDGLAPHCLRCAKDKSLRHSYNVTVDWYEETLAAQDGGCALCGGQPSSGRALHVDHDHACCPGVRSCGSCVRALLCDLCNMTLGSARDDTALLRRMITYVDQHRNRAV